MGGIIQKIDLFYQEGSSDKEYHLQVIEDGAGYVVNFQYGRRGSALKDGSKTSGSTSLEEAKKIYERIVAEKIGKGYKPSNIESNSYVTAPIVKDVFFIPQLLNPIDESDIEKWLADDSYGSQEKMDGRHQAISKKAGDIRVTNKKGQVIGYPELLKDSFRTDLLIDTEAIGDSFYAFDILEANGEDLRNMGYVKRYKVLEAYAKTFKPGVINVVPLAVGVKNKRALYNKLKEEGREGIVFKRLEAPYTSGKAHGDMWKCKFLSDVSCRVCAGRIGKRSVGLELLDESGKWVSVGNVTIGSPKISLPEVGQVIDVTYLYANKGGSLFQPVFKAVRDDVDERECVMSQLKFKSED